MLRYSKWLELPFATRVKLAEIFDLKRVGAVEVASNQVVKDGYSLKELEEKITTDTMQAYLDTFDGGEDDDILFDLVVEKATYVPTAPVAAQEIITKTTVTETVVRPVASLETAEKAIEEINRTQETPTVVENVPEITETPHAETKKSSKK